MLSFFLLKHSLYHHFSLFFINYQNDPISWHYFSIDQINWFELIYEIKTLILDDIFYKTTYFHINKPHFNLSKYSYDECFEEMDQFILSRYPVVNPNIDSFCLRNTPECTSFMVLEWKLFEYGISFKVCPESIKPCLTMFKLNDSSNKLFQECKKKEI